MSSHVPSTLRLPARSRAVPTHARAASRRVPAVVVPVLAILLGGGVVVAAQVSGHWATTGRDALGSASGAVASTGTGQGPESAAVPASPDDVKGWMTIQQVVDAGFPGVTESALRAEFGIPATVPASTALKELDGSVSGFDMTALRAWLSAAG